MSIPRAPESATAEAKEGVPTHCIPLVSVSVFFLHQSRVVLYIVFTSLDDGILFIDGKRLDDRIPAK